MILGFCIGPQDFHRLQRIAGLGPAVVEIPPHNFGLFAVPAGPDAKDKTATGEVIEGGNLLRQQERVTLWNQGNPGSEPQGGGHG